MSSVQNFTLYDVLVRNATAFGDRLALVTEDGEERSFAELRERVDALAAGLDGLGLEVSDRLAVLAQNSAAYVELYLACARQGIVVYPINWRLQPGEIEMLVRERAKPRAFVVGADFLDAVPGGPGDDAIPTGSSSVAIRRKATPRWTRSTPAPARRTTCRGPTSPPAIPSPSSRPPPST